MFIKITGLLLLLILAGIPLFMHLDALPFRLWDESRLASNAYEMHKNGNLIVTHYDGQPEMWNTKPPLMIWLQVFFIKILGFNELSVRLPSATAGIFTCLLLVLFSRKYFNDYLPGAFACLVLVTTNGYVDTHAIRTGDYDGLLALFTTMFVLAGFLYVENRSKNSLNVFFAGLTLAILTKSVQPLLFLPGIALWMLINKKSALLVTRRFLLGSLLTIVIVAGYYFMREVRNQGYLLAIWNNELGGRYFNALEENDAGPLYYISRIAGYLFPYWIWLLPVGIITGIFSRDVKIKRLTIYTFIVTLTYFIFITVSKTKLYWYTVPLFPLLSIHLATLLYQTYSFLKERSFFNRYHIAALLAVCLVFIYPYQNIGRKVYHPQEYSWDNMYPVSEFLQDAFHGRSSMDNYVIAYKDFNQHLKVYTDALNDRKQNIQYKQPDSLSAGDTVIASEADVYKAIESRYAYKLLKDERGVKVYLIGER